MPTQYPGDDLIADAAMVYDRKRLVRAPPAQVFPWLAQLGATRAGWYLTSFWESFIPRSWRAARTIHSEWQNLKIGDRVEDYKMGMGDGEYFIVSSFEPPTSIVYTSERLGTLFTWTLMCHAHGDNHDITEVHLRFRGRILRRGWQRRVLVKCGDWLDWIFTEPMLSGLAERCEKHHQQ